MKNYTRCPRNNLPKRKLFFSTNTQSNEQFFFYSKEESSKFYLKKKFHKYCSKVLPLTSIQKFSLFRILPKTFCNVSFFIDLISFLILFFKSSISSILLAYTFVLIKPHKKSPEVPKILDHLYQSIFHQNFHSTMHELLFRNGVERRPAGK